MGYQKSNLISWGQLAMVDLANGLATGLVPQRPTWPGGVAPRMYITYDKGIPAKIGLTKISRRTKILVYGKIVNMTH